MKTNIKIDLNDLSYVTCDFTDKQRFDFILLCICKSNNPQEFADKVIKKLTKMNSNGDID